MKPDKIEYKNINETLYEFDHKSGLKAFVIPKKGYSKKYAAFCTHFGSINSKFIIPGENEPTSVPEGVAHFLEHKLFEQKDGNVMDKFSRLGSNPNAYTGFNQTAYLFSCTEKFDDNFKLLIDYVQNPYITQESVEKEKGIIGQEIMMYRDDPNWRAFFNLLQAFYKSNPVRADIAGTIESIGKIDRDMLYKCYNTFYHPSNMMIIVVGDIEPVNVFEMVEANIGNKNALPEIAGIFPEESKNINKNYIEQALSVSMPLFQMGFRDNRLDTYGKECLLHETGVKILLEMILGRSSELYNRLYNEGILNSTFEFDYTIEEKYAFSMFGGESSDPSAVKEKLTDTIKGLYRDGLAEESYERVKKAMYGKFVRQLNSIERIAHAFISVYFKKVNIFDYLDVYDKISFEYISDIFREHFNLDNLALSVIKPV